MPDSNKTGILRTGMKFWKPLAAIIIWGLSFIATKHVLNELEPLSIIILRQLIGSVFLIIIAVKKGSSFNPGIKNLKGIIILSLIAALHLTIQVSGMQYTSALNTGWLVGITPVFMALLGLLFFNEKITLPQSFGIVIAFAGLVVLISKGNLSSVSFISNKGDFLVLASSFTWGVYSLINKKVSFNYSPLMTILFLFLFMSLYLAPFTINHKNIEAVINLTLTSWGALLFLGIFCSGIAYVLWAQALNEMSSSQVGAFLYIEPFVTLIGSWLLLKEEISMVTILGGVTIIAGVIFVNRK
jgi:RarD protein